MRRAVHAQDAGLVRRPLLRAGMLAAAALVFASACLDDPASAPDDLSVRLGISAQVNGGHTVAIDVYYRRLTSGLEILVPLQASPARVAVQPGTVQQRVTVVVTPCIDDPQRERIAGRENACPLVIILRLLDEQEDEIDSERIEPEAPEPGETVTLPTVTLQQPELALTPARLAFEATQGGELPEAQVVEITNGGGGSLGTLSIEIEGEAAEWLEASLGENAATVIVQPATTALEAGTHEATVLVSSEGVGNSPRPIAVTFEVAAIPTYTLTIVGDGTGTGRVTSEPEGIDCTITAGVVSGVCVASFDEGTLVFLDATAAAGSSFDDWRGACEGAEGCGVTMMGAREVTATFGLVRHRLTVTGSGSGAGNVVSEPAGIDCRYQDGVTDGTCVADFPLGTNVELAAEGDREGFSVFREWSGACEGGGDCDLDITRDLEVTATFEVEIPVVIVGDGTGSGRVTSTPVGIDCVVDEGSTSGDCDERFPLGTALTLHAVADTGSVGGILTEGTDPEFEVTLDDLRTHSFTARFNLDRRRITIAGAGTGSGTVVSTPAGISCTLTTGVTSGTCQAFFLIGSELELVATPSGTDTFAGWSDGCTSAALTCTLTVTGTSTVTSTFHALQALTLDLAGTGTGSVSVSPSGIVCSIVGGKPGGTCSASFPFGTPVTLTAMPAAGMAHRWDGACLPFGTATNCTLTMDQARQAIAIFSDPCALIRPHALFSSVEGEITTSDCRQRDGRYGDIHRLSLGSQQLFQLEMRSPDMATELWIALGGGFWFSIGNQTSSHHILAPAGAFNISTQNNVPHDLGRYTLTSSATDATGCLAIRTTFNISADLVLDERDCRYIASNRPTGVGSPSDRATIYVAPSQTLRVTVTSLDKAFQPLIELRPGTNDAIWYGELLGTTAEHDGGSFASLQFVGGDDGDYVQVWVTSRTVGGVGPYRIAIDEPRILPAATTDLRTPANQVLRAPPTSAGATSGGGSGSATPLPPP